MPVGIPKPEEDKLIGGTFLLLLSKFGVGKGVMDGKGVDFWWWGRLGEVLKGPCQMGAALSVKALITCGLIDAIHHWSLSKPSVKNHQAL